MTESDILDLLFEAGFTAGPRRAVLRPGSRHRGRRGAGPADAGVAARPRYGSGVRAHDWIGNGASAPAASPCRGRWLREPILSSPRSRDASPAERSTSPAAGPERPAGRAGLAVTESTSRLYALDEARNLAADRHVTVEWVEADVLGGVPPAESFELVRTGSHLHGSLRRAAGAPSMPHALFPAAACSSSATTRTTSPTGWGGPAIPASSTRPRSLRAIWSLSTSNVPIACHVRLPPTRRADRDRRARDRYCSLSAPRGPRRRTEAAGTEEACGCDRRGRPSRSEALDQWTAMDARTGVTRLSQ